MLSNEEFKVYDFQAAKKVKERLGRTAAIPMSKTPDSPEMTKHEDEAMALANPVPKKESLYTKTMSFLGLE